jgi:uncharacterized protein (TIGR03435 family)
MRKTTMGLAFASMLFAQDLRFEVASVRRGTPGRSGGGLQTGNGRLLVENETLKRCIMGAFSVGPNQIVGWPAWLGTDTFHIEAKAEEPVGDGAIMQMLQQLLKDRFKLEAHRESRTIQAYVLSVAKNGPKLEKSAGGGSTTENSRGRISARATTMDHFAQVLSRQMDFPVLNETGLDGVYDLTLEWTNADTGPSIFVALQEQLGLRLSSRKAAVDVLVIDHVERPTEN